MAGQNDETIRLLLQVMGIKDLEELKARADDVRDGFEEAAKKTDKATGSTRDLGRAALEGSRVLQDFVQGGIGGILNNVEGLTRALGGTAGMAGLLTGVGVAAFIALPHIKSFLAAIIDGSNDIPESADRLERLNDALKDNGDRLKELKDKQKLTNTELAEYNRLLGEQAGLEKAANDAKEDKTSLDALRRKEREARLDKTAAADVAAAIGESGGVDAVLDQLTGQMTGTSAATAQRDQLAKEWEARLKDMRPDLRAAAGLDRDKEIAAADKAIEAARRADRDRAEAILGGAAQGDLGDVNRLMDLSPNIRAGVGRQRTRRDLETQRERAQEQSQRNADYWNDRREGGEARRKAFDDAQAKSFDQIKRWQDGNDRAAERADKAAEKEAKDKTRADAKAAADAEREAERQAAANAPGARLRAMREQAYQSAAGMALDQNNGEFNPAQLDAIARQAAANTQGLDAGSIQDAINRAAWMTREKLQADLQRAMGRQQVQSDSYYGPWGL